MVTSTVIIEFHDVPDRPIDPLPILESLSFIPMIQRPLIVTYPFFVRLGRHGSRHDINSLIWILSARIPCPCLSDSVGSAHG